MSDADSTAAKTALITVIRSTNYDDHVRWSIVPSENGGHLFVTEELDGDDEWNESESSTSADDWQSLLSEHPELTTLIADDFFYVLHASEETRATYLEQITSSDPACTIDNAQLAQALAAGERFFLLPHPDAREMVLVFGDWDEVHGLVIAKHTWNDDYFPSTTGGIDLIEVAPGLALSNPYADLAIAHAPKLIAFNDYRSAFMDWLMDIPGGMLMAIQTLEPFDPNNTLTAQQRAEWDERLDDGRWTLELNLNEPDLADLRRAFVPEEIDTAVPEQIDELIEAAFVDPNGAAGAKLREALNESGYLFDLYLNL